MQLENEGRFVLRIPVRLAHGEQAPWAFRRSWCRGWLRNWVIDLDPSLSFLAHELPKFLRRSRVAVTLGLPAQILDDPALGPIKESSSNTVLGVRAEIRMTRIGSSLLKPGIGEVKLSIACTILYAKNEYSKNNSRLSEVLPYQVPFHYEMVSVHLISWRPTAGIIEHFLLEFHHPTDPDVVRCFLSQILKTVVLPCGVDLFLQGCYSAG
jgi:hypothetical protein